MEQLPAIFGYALIAVLVPVLIARVVVGADWRTVRNACLIWYGLLLLAFGGLTSAEGFGWAMIFAMFWSIPALPVVALAVKLCAVVGRWCRGHPRG